MKETKRDLRYGVDYPKQCPPPEAHLIEKELKLFRICACDRLEQNGLLNEEIFIPVWEQKGRKFPPKKECEAKAISFSSDLKRCYELISNFPKIGSKIILVKLNSQCGLLLESENHVHYNLWDYANPDLPSAIGDEWEEVIKNDSKIKVQ